MNTNTNTMANTNPPSEAEIIFNRANIALARSQRLVASWLPPQQSETSNGGRTENQKNDNDNAADDNDDDEIFTAVPERLGLGAPVPVKDAFNSLGSGTVSSNKLDDKLRQRLLGRNAKKFMQQQQQKQKQQTSAQRTGKDDAVQKNGSGTKTVDDSDDDEDSDEGRTSLGKPRVPKPMKKSNQTQKSESIQLDTEYLSTAGSDADNMKSSNKNNDDRDTIAVEAQHSTTTTPAATAAARSQHNKRRKIAKISYLDEILQDRKKKKKRGNE